MDNEQHGIFPISQITGEKAKNFFAQHKMMVIKFDSPDDKKAIIKMYEDKTLDHYEGLAIIQKQQGMENFKKNFHRSISFTDKMLPHQECEQIFPTQFWKEIQKHGEIQVKLVKQINPR